MGGIWFCVYDNTFSSVRFNTEFIKAFENLKTRGDGISPSQLLFEESIRIDQVNKDILKRTLKRSEIVNFKSYTFAFGYHRLAINDPSPDGDQPFELITSSSPNMRIGINTQSVKKLSMCNGEIYNWREICNKFKLTNLVSENDCEVILHLYNKLIGGGMDDLNLIKTITNELDGEYSFVIGDNIQTYDKKLIKAYVVRDPLGLKPLYYLRKKDNTLMLFVSELKGIPIQFLDDPEYEISSFSPGHFWSFQNWWKGGTGIQKYYDEFEGVEYKYINRNPETIENLYETLNNLLRKSIIKRIDRPLAVTISGGLSSSIIANLVLDIIKEQEQTIEFFTIGHSLECDDIFYAKKLVEYFNEKYQTKFKHHIITCNESLLIEKRKEIIENAIETNNEDIIQACIPFSFLYEYMSKFTPYIKVNIAGDGCDLLFENHDNLFSLLQKTTTLKVDKLSSLYGLETRIPYLDLEFVKFCLSIHPNLKELVPIEKDNLIEKYILRKANETSNIPLPKEFLFRESVKINLN